jgi:hypothetical protein
MRQPGTQRAAGRKAGEHGGKLEHGRVEQAQSSWAMPRADAGASAGKKQ